MKPQFLKEHYLEYLARDVFFVLGAVLLGLCAAMSARGVGRWRWVAIPPAGFLCIELALFVI